MPMSPSTSSPAPEVAHTDSNHSNDDHSIDDDVVVGPASKKAKTEDEQTSDSSPSRGNEKSISTDGSRINTDHDDGDDDDQQQKNQQQLEEEENSSVDSEEDINLEEVEPDSDEDSLFQRILAAAAAQGIPLEYLAARGLPLPLGFGVDDAPVEYPFDDPPTSIEDVANFIQSEQCQRIMVLAG